MRALFILASAFVLASSAGCLPHSFNARHEFGGKVVCHTAYHGPFETETTTTEPAPVAQGQKGESIPECPQP